MKIKKILSVFFIMISLFMTIKSSFAEANDVYIHQDDFNTVLNETFWENIAGNNVVTGGQLQIRGAGDSGVAMKNALNSSAYHNLLFLFQMQFSGIVWSSEYNSITRGHINSQWEGWVPLPNAADFGCFYDSTTCYSIQSLPNGANSTYRMKWNATHFCANSTGTNMACTTNIATSRLVRFGMQVPAGNAFFNISYIEICDDIDNDGNCSYAPTAGSSITINISDSTPATETQYNTFPIFFSLYANTTYANTNATLYLNGTANQNYTIGAGTNINVTFNKTLSDGNWTYFISVYDNTTNKNTSLKFFYVDTVNPTIITDFINNSFYYNNNVTAQFNFSDTQMLHSYNISIDGINIQGNNSIDLPSLNITLNYNATPLSMGLHRLNVTIRDGHTSLSLLSDYSFNNGIFNDYAKYSFNYPYNKGSIRIQQKDGSLFDKWDSEKQKDRYIFSFEPSVKSNTYTFSVEAEGNIYIVNAPNTKYKIWLIYDNHWLDFMPYEVSNIKRISDTKVEVTIINIDLKLSKLTFNSIGDLNILTKNYIFYTTNATLTYTSPVLQLEQQTISIDILTTGINRTNATLTYNGTSKTLTKTAYAAYDHYETTFFTPTFSNNANITINATYYLYGNQNTKNGSLTAIQTVSSIGIDNCSVFTARGINFTIINVTDNSVINSSADGNFGIYLIFLSNNKKFNLTWGNQNKQEMCISPDSAYFNLTGQIEFFIGSITKTYYFINSTISNKTQNINLYLGDGSTLVAFTVTDENSNYVVGAYITILVYDFGTNTYIISEIIKTDSQGKAIGNIVLNTQWYKFIITYNDVIYLESEPTKLITNTYSFTINLGSDYFENYEQTAGVSCNIQFDNASKCFIYTYSTSSGSVTQGCLEIYRVNSNSNIIINSSCVSAASSTINLCIGEDVKSNHYIGEGNVYLGGYKFLCDEEYANFNEGFKQWGGEGLMITFLVMITLVMIGIYNPIVAITLMVVALVFSIIMGIFYLSWGMLIALIILAGITMYKLRQN